MSEMEITTDAAYPVLLLGRLNGFFETQEYTDVTLQSFTDVTLQVGSVEVQCHRVTLAAASEYFHAMFRSGLKESRSNVIKIVGTDSETLLMIVKYIYSAKIKITIENVQDIVQASDQFRLNGLLKLCEEFMVQQISAANSIGFYKFADRYRLKGLKDGARANMLNNFAEVVRANEFNEMAVEEVIEYISDNALDVPTEDAVFDAVCTWVRFDAENRVASFPQIVEHIRLPLCTPSYLTKTVSSYPPIRNSVCHQYLEEALTYMMPEHRHHLSGPRTMPRLSCPIHRCMLVLGGACQDGDFCQDIKYLNHDGASWGLLSKLPVKVIQFSAVVVQSGIIITGGSENSLIGKRDCWLFEVTQKKWSSVSPMKHGRCRHGSVVHNEHVYVAGGLDSTGKKMKSVEMYRQRQQQWFLIPPMPKELRDVQTVSCGHYICVLSSHNVNLFLYDTVWGKWEQRADMPQKVDLISAETVNDELYVVGGLTRSCMRYDTQSDLWTTLTSPRDLHGLAATTTLQGKIMLVGGKTGDSLGDLRTTVVEEYSPKDDEWAYSTIGLEQPLSSHRLLVLDL